MLNKSKLKKVVILGSGPIVIGQACEFDYSGTQACKALMQEGLEVILINSNPATIMTDPELATRIYIEPLQADFVAKILEKERPDAIIPTLGGQTALNLGLQLADSGILAKLGIEMLGANPDVIRAAEDREKFRSILDSVGAKYPKSEMVRTYEQGMSAADSLGFPLILRPNYTLGGGGGGVAYSMEEYQSKLAYALHESPTSEVLVEESILGWKEFELEVMRDKSGTFVVICSIENIDPCGVHTGDSITVAPQQTLSDYAYQDLRNEARKIIDAVGVETGGANIQFAVHPTTGERLVIEMNPRVSRSSALASKATGFPIAKIAALLAIGYKLDGLLNDITKTTPSCYEPALDYVVTKIPRFAFEKFPGTRDYLTTQMRSVGEVMGIGRTFKESLQKAVLSLEENARGLTEVTLDEGLIATPNSKRLYHIVQAFREGWSLDQVHQLTQITPWFLEQIKELPDFEQELREDYSKNSTLTYNSLLKAKRLGFSDSAIATVINGSAKDVEKIRQQLKIRPSYLQVDTCAGEFASQTPYYYSTYWSSSPQKNHSLPHSVVLLGSGPNRIGQGVEFDYSCVRSVRQFQKLGYKVAMVNSNPETVSTDYDTSDCLFFEPLTYEHISEIIQLIQPEGYVAQLGGQTPINLAAKLSDSGFNLLGSSLNTIDLAEDRAQFAKICHELDFKMPRAAMATSLEDGLNISAEIGFPLICRPSYVLGGRRMEIVEDEEELRQYFARHGSVITPKSPCLMDQFLERALEVDVDLVRGPDWLVIGGVMEHIEAAGVHSGDSMGVVPPQRLRPEILAKIEDLSSRLAHRLGVLGFLNLQLAVQQDQIYMLEANPRSSRSVPFISKATSIPIVDLGVKAIVGLNAAQVHPERYDWKNLVGVNVKGVVFPFKKFPDADSILGPEMKSTGESMGRGSSYEEAILKAFLSSHYTFPSSGEVFLSLRENDKQVLLPSIKELSSLGYTFSATNGTAKFLLSQSIDCEVIKKVHEGRPNCVDRIRSGEIAFVINTTSGRTSIEASAGIRRSCVDFSIPCLTESDAVEAFVLALKSFRAGHFEVSPLPKLL
ncbi:MAG: carbamoyl-phosphate synthase large subunit [Bdellovibrionales bacterium]|nr:carbamoyl-phosphate synthase large subunit [Bdellovibrionales bacterium]